MSIDPVFLDKIAELARNKQRFEDAQAEARTARQQADAKATALAVLERTIADQEVAIRLLAADVAAGK